MRDGHKFCKYAMYGEVKKAKVLLPLTKVDIKSEIRGAMVTQQIELTYTNPRPDRPLECTYTFPIERKSLLAKLEVTIDDSVIVTKVQ